MHCNDRPGRQIFGALVTSIYTNNTDQKYSLFTTANETSNANTPFAGIDVCQNNSQIKTIGRLSRISRRAYKTEYLNMYTHKQTQLNF